MNTGWKAQVTMALEGDHPTLGRSIAFLLQALIVVSALSIGLETLPDLPPWTTKAFAVEEATIVVIFTLEYFLRVAAAERPLAYVLSFWGAVDLIAILPFYLSLGIDLRSARAFRLLRVFRILKLARYSAAVERLGAALQAALEELVVFGITAVVLLYICSVFIYYFEHDAQPKAFSSVFASMWWAAITLTTVGYGDVYPITTGGRIFTVIMLLIALGIIAVPTGIIASALSHIRDREPDG